MLYNRVKENIVNDKKDVQAWQPVTLTQDGQVSQPAAAQTEPASAVKIPTL